MDTSTINNKVDAAFSKVVPTLHGSLQLNTQLMITLKKYMNDNVPLIQEFLKHAYLADNAPNYIGVWDVMDNNPDLKPVANHSRRVARYVEMMGEELGLPLSFITKLKHAGHIHDVGKAFILKEMLYGDNLDASSRELMLVRQGHAILSDVMWNILGYTDETVGSPVIYHHDVLNGYPHMRKLVKLDDGNLQTVTLGNTQDRLVILGDVADACADTRGYQARMNPEQALQRIKDINKKFNVFELRYVDALEHVIVDRNTDVKKMYQEDGIEFAI